jgi:hypothetical protein
VFIKDQDIKGVKRDEWGNVYFFFKQNPNDLSNYDEDGAWPLIYDSFAEWLREKGEK